VGKPHFKEQHIPYNNTWFMWAIFQDQNKSTIPMAKQCIQGQCIEVSLHMKLNFNSSCPTVVLRYENIPPTLLTQD
jgi:hypothetical protein